VPCSDKWSAEEHGLVWHPALRFQNDQLCFLVLSLLQRLSVVATDGVLVSAAWFGTRRYPEPRRTAAFLLLAANAGLLIVDHIHFQYNGMLLGNIPGPVRFCREDHTAFEQEALDRV
jgi:hypothetical protein